MLMGDPRMMPSDSVLNRPTKLNTNIDHAAGNGSGRIGGGWSHRSGYVRETTASRTRLNTELPISAAYPERGRTILLPFPVLRAEGLERRLIANRVDLDWLSAVDGCPWPYDEERLTYLLELPQRAPPFLLAGVREHREMLTLDLEPRGGCCGCDTRTQKENGQRGSDSQATLPDVCHSRLVERAERPTSLPRRSWP